MSWDMLKLIFECEKHLRPIEDHVLLYIANKVNEKKGNVAWCSHPYWCRKTGSATATIGRACKSLKEKGIISWAHKKAYNSKYKTNHYTINYSSLRTMVKQIEVSERITHITHTDNQVGITVSNNNLAYNLYKQTQKKDLRDRQLLFYKISLNNTTKLINTTIMDGHNLTKDLLSFLNLIKQKKISLI